MPATEKCIHCDDIFTGFTKSSARSQLITHLLKEHPGKGNVKR